MADLRWGERTLQPGKYTVIVTKRMAITVESPETIHDSDLVIKALFFGDNELKVEKQGEGEDNNAKV